MEEKEKKKEAKADYVASIREHPPHGPPPISTSFNIRFTASITITFSSSITMVVRHQHRGPNHL